MKKIAVLYLGKKGAGPVYTLEMTKALLEFDTEVLAVLSEYAENKPQWEALEKERDNLRIVFVKTYRGVAGFVFNTVTGLSILSARRAIKRFRPDLLYATMNHPWHSILFRMARKHAGIRVKTVHDAIPHTGEDGFFHRLLHRTEFGHADKYVVLTRAAIPVLEAKGIRKDRIIHIPHAHFGVYNETGRLPEPSRRNRILFFGRINPYKGLNVLLEAMKLVVRKNADIKLVIAGDGDCKPFSAWFEELSAHLELRIGWIPESGISDILTQADAVVLPYTEATQSGVIPLAYGFGKPVVATRVGGIPEQVVDGRTGLLVAPDSASELAEAVLRLYAEPGMLERMGAAAFDYAQTELSWSGSARRLLDATAG